MERASSAEQLRLVAELRADAYYAELASRNALPFPSRFLPAFRREFAERELRSLQLRTTSAVGASLRCACLVVLRESSAGPALLGCADVSWRAGPCSSDINGTLACEAHAYMDNLAVTPLERRQGVASSLVCSATRLAAEEWGAEEVHAHCHAQNHRARRLYVQLGFRAPVLAERRRDGLVVAAERMSGLLMLTAKVPLVPLAEREGGQRGSCGCGGADFGLSCVC